MKKIQTRANTNQIHHIWYVISYKTCTAQVPSGNIKFSSDLRAKILHFCGLFAQKLNQ